MRWDYSKIPLTFANLTPVRFAGPPSPNLQGEETVRERQNGLIITVDSLSSIVFPFHFQPYHFQGEIQVPCKAGQ